MRSERRRRGRRRRAPRCARAARAPRAALRCRRPARGSRRPSTRREEGFDASPSSSSRTAPPTTYASRSSERNSYPTSAQTRAIASISTSAPEGSFATSTVERCGRRRAHVRGVHLVHAGEVVEALQEDRGLDECVERAAGLLEDRAEVLEHLLGLRLDVAAEQVFLTRAKRELPRDEDEAVRLDRLRVRRSLERCGCCFGADGFLRHDCSFASGMGRHAWPSAAPTDLKIEARTCCGSVPSTTRTCTFSAAVCASSCRKREATSVASPPTRWSGEIDVRDEARTRRLARAPPRRVLPPPERAPTRGRRRPRRKQLCERGAERAGPRPRPRRRGPRGRLRA